MKTTNHLCVKLEYGGTVAAQNKVMLIKAFPGSALQQTMSYVVEQMAIPQGDFYNPPYSELEKDTAERLAAALRENKTNPNSFLVQVKNPTTQATKRIELTDRLQDVAQGHGVDERVDDRKIATVYLVASTHIGGGY